MKFFKVREDVESIGLRELVPLWEYDIEAPTSQSKLSDKRLPELEPQFSRLLVTGPLTDVLADGRAIGGTGFIVSDKLKKLLAEFNLGTHRFYSLKSFEYNSDKKLDVEYYWLQIIGTIFYDLIDYNNSSFFIFDDFEEKIINKIDVRTPGGMIEAINSTKETDNSIIYNKMVFNDKFIKYNLDLFYLNNISDNLFTYPIVSDRLKEKIEQYGVSGLEFKEVPIYLSPDFT
ncbi:imm11 family protein [Hymenobacter volaticus]|uniref:Immunity MXAN-0049 protein domain-containing protein n=1 Tax=Hymenobacter volaticus TaxID=2932254 RepID=A0ABY4GD53_9BACT|nr:DUF1629 domain-containing protein [Hymenobacter volaticus]UOQ68850.1 hypothetical protein MUN86_24385 [Hymenobacter volaticus]